MNQPTLEPILYALEKIINRTVFAYHIAEPVVEALLDEVLRYDLVLTLQRQQQRVTILELHTSQKHAYTIVRHDELHERASTASTAPYYTTLSLAMSTLTRLPVLCTGFSKVKYTRVRVPWLNGPVNITPP